MILKEVFVNAEIVDNRLYDILKHAIYLSSWQYLDIGVLGCLENQNCQV